MKNIFIFAFVITLFIPVSSYAAIGVSVLQSTDGGKPFDVKTREINKVSNTNITRFRFGAVESKTNTSEKIAHWEIRVWCDKNAQISLDDSVTDICNGTNNVFTEAPGNFFLFLTKDNKETPVRFSFKLKAFAPDGTWIHSERRAFLW